MDSIVQNQAFLGLLSDRLKERLRNKLREELDGLLVCTRSWEAWSYYGTMSEDDFESIAYDDKFIEELANSILLTLANNAPAAGTDMAF